MDEFMRKDMKNSFDFDRTITDQGVRYASPTGFVYKMRRMGFDNELCSMEIPKIDDKNGTIEILQKLAETSPDFAAEMFEKLHREYNLCPKCTLKNGGAGCRHATKYELNGKVKYHCGSFNFQWTVEDFENTRKLMKFIAEVLNTSAVV